MYRLKITIVGARDLHKADTLSLSDPYCIVYSGGQEKAKTKVIDNTLNPSWNYSANIDVAADKPLVLWVYDHNTIKKDKPLGQVEVPWPPAPGTHSLRLHPADPKYTENQTLQVTFSPLMKSFAMLSSEMSGKPGVFCDRAKQKVLVPAAALAGASATLGSPVVTAIEYEKDGYDVKLYLLSPTIFVDVVVHGQPKTTVRRRRYPSGKRDLIPAELGAVFEEIKLDDVPLSVPRDRIQFIAFDRVVDPAQGYVEIGLDKIVSDAGWSGAMGYKDCRSRLRGCEYNDADEEVLIPTPESGVALLVDFDKGNVDVKLGVFDGASSATSAAYELAMAGATTVSRVLPTSRPWPNASGTRRLLREYQLDDVPYGSGFASMKLTRTPITNMRQAVLSQIVPL
eukprot:TRINITY_DN58923_c0_g1_i1.p1 TRINITY_DN58923_c0_g1~~TRINITY_DN58923_c0_g1_i1.p1  ORF type:complete len:397 (+),score=89.90 TRINITY_DN58923_c0_g1_i1:175-1365(+)